MHFFKISFLSNLVLFCGKEGATADKTSPGFIKKFGQESVDAIWVSLPQMKKKDVNKVLTQNQTAIIKLYMVSLP